MRAAVLMVMLLAVGVAQAIAPREMEIFVMPDGDVTIDKGPVLSFAKFKERMKPLLRRKPCVPFRIRSGAETPFEPIGRVVMLLQASGCGKIGFLTEPANRN